MAKWEIEPQEPFDPATFIDGMAWQDSEALREAVNALPMQEDQAAWDYLWQGYLSRGDQLSQRARELSKVSGELSVTKGELESANANVKKLADELATARAEAGKLREKIEAEVGEAKVNQNNAIRQLEAERKAHGETKGELLDALLTVERAKGYIEATEDAKPPRMVEAPRESHDVFSRQSSYGEFHSRPAGSKRWFER